MTPTREQPSSSPHIPTREQLELSALAAGVGIAWDKERGEFYIQPSELGCERAWRPDLDSAQCFDMETACRMNVTFKVEGSWWVWSQFYRVKNEQPIIEHASSDLARKWASLLVAVEIGRRMRESKHE